jgi:hypothetical protein
VVAGSGGPSCKTVAMSHGNNHYIAHGVTVAGTPPGFIALLQTFGNNRCQWVVLSPRQIGLEKIMTRSARIGLTAALLVGGATIAMAQNGPPTGGYPPARWNPNFYGHSGYHHRYYAYYPVYPTVAGYWDYYRTSWPGRGNGISGLLKHVHARRG